MTCLVGSHVFADTTTTNARTEETSDGHTTINIEQNTTEEDEDQLTPGAALLPIEAGILFGEAGEWGDEGEVNINNNYNHDGNWDGHHRDNARDHRGQRRNGQHRGGQHHGGGREHERGGR